MDRQRVTNILTLIIVCVWIVFAVVRVWVEIPAAVILDSAMPVVIGYWFASSAIPLKKEENDYVGEHRAES
jgi:hypothetical protein